jgi:Gram-negative bacterial TonB protein C-terminal
MLKTAAIVGCFLALLSSAAAPAMEMDYPALGVRLTELPADSKTLGDGDMWKGYRVRIAIDRNASIVISRFDQVVSQGNLADKGYRDALRNQLDIQPVSGSVRKLVTVAGQPAWLVGSAQRVGPMALYQCNYLLVVDHHLYEIAISAVGESKAATSSFETAAESVGSVVFGPVQPRAEKPLAAGEMPPFLLGNGSNHFYPDSARRLGEQGAVELKFSIDGAGSAQGVQAAGDANADLVKSAESYLADGGFKVPQGWEQSGGPKQTFTMEFRFELSCPDAHPPPQVVPEAQLVTICASILQR